MKKVILVLSKNNFIDYYKVLLIIISKYINNNILYLKNKKN